MARRIVVVILTYNAARFIGPCLAALRKNTPLSPRILVVDNASTDGTLEIVRREHPWAEIRETGGNLGVAKGNNLALVREPADAYVLLNPDTEVQPGWLEALLAEVDADPRVGIVGGKLLYPDGRIQHAGGEASPTGPRHVGVLAPGTAFDEARDVDYVTFACALVTRAVVDKIGYLDEAYTPYYYEDADFCFRARAAGFRVRYTPRCLVTHHEGATMSAMSAAKARIFERNRLRFKMQHDPRGWWARSAWQEAKTLAGHTLRGRGSAILGAWGQTIRERGEIRARRDAPTAFVHSMWER